jgi:peroxiredoxin
MKSIVLSAIPLLLGALILGFVFAAEADIGGPKIGERFPNALVAPDQSGKAQTLKSLMGEKGIAVFFVRSADWCPFCQGQLVDANRHLSRFRSLGLTVVSVSVDDVSKIAAFAQAQHIGYKMLSDPLGDINLSLGIRDQQYPVGSAAFGVPRPTLYVIDPNGVIRLRYQEPTYKTRPDLDRVLLDVEAAGL